MASSAYCLRNSVLDLSTVGFFRIHWTLLKKEELLQVMERTSVYMFMAPWLHKYDCDKHHISKTGIIMGLTFCTNQENGGPSF